MALRACPRLMDGPFRKFRVPPATFLGSRPGMESWPAIPTSMGITSAPAFLAMMQTQEQPFAMFPATMAVTSCPVWVTPSSTIPLSAHITTMAFLPISTAAVPDAPAIRTMSSSRTPRLFSGFGPSV